jgi:AcrR family transcriptional regulator
VAADAPRDVVRKRNPRGQGGALREQLIDAAARLLASAEQPESLTLRQVAREVGVAPASIYGHFADFGALFNHILDLRYRELAGVLRAAGAQASPLGRLVGICVAYVGWGVHHPGEYRTLFGGRIPPGVTIADHEPGVELLEFMTAALAGVVDPEGCMAPEEHAEAGLLMWTSLHGLVAARAEHPKIDWPPWRDQAAAIVALHSANDRHRIAEFAANVAVQ